MGERYGVIIVGAGHGGGQTAIALRQNGFHESILVVGEEPDLPYERPPLSKEYLSGEKDFDRLLLRPTTFWAERDVEFLTGKRVVAVDSTAHTIMLESEEVIGYDRLVWSAGGHARRLGCQGHNLAGVHSVRSRSDVDVLIAELPEVRRVAVVGGGFIGLEAAAVLVKAGKAVTVLEAADRVLARVSGPELSHFYEAQHRAHGVDVRLGVGVAELQSAAGRLAGVLLADGGVVAADMVIVGIGIIPAVEPLIAAGARGGNGVAVDAQCRTSLPDVFAIGDCALHANAFADGATVRLESVQNANDMAATVAKVVTGSAAVYNAVPWFWSTQYDLRLQTVGLSAGYDQTVVRGRMSNVDGFSVVYLKAGRVIALDCVNATRDYVQGRALVVARARIPAEMLADASRSLKDLATGG